MLRHVPVYGAIVSPRVWLAGIAVWMARVLIGLGRHQITTLVAIKPSVHKHKTYRTSRQTQVGIGYSVRTHRGGYVQNGSRRRLLHRRGANQTRLKAEQPRVDQGRRRRLANMSRTGAGGCTPQMTHPARIPRQEPNTATACAKGGDGPGLGCCRRVGEGRCKTCRGRHNGRTIGRKCRHQHRLGMIGSRTRPEKVIPEKGSRHAVVQARDARSLKQQVFHVYMYVCMISM